MDLFNFTKDFIETVNKEFYKVDINFRVPPIQNPIEDKVSIKITVDNNSTMLDESIRHIERATDDLGIRMAVDMCRELKAYINKQPNRKQTFHFNAGEMLVDIDTNSNMNDIDVRKGE